MSQTTTKSEAKKKGSKNDVFLTTSEIAKLFGLTARRIQQLTQDGILHTVDGNGAKKYSEMDTVRDYIQFWKDKAEGKGDKTKVSAKEEEKLEHEIELKRAKAKIATLELEELEGKMHRSEDVESMTSDLCLAIRSIALALPGRLAVDLAEINSAAEVSAKIKIEINQMLEELSNYQYDPNEYRRRVRDRQGWLEKHGDEEDE